MQLAQTSDPGFIVFLSPIVNARIFESNPSVRAHGRVLTGGAESRPMSGTLGVRELQTINLESIVRATLFQRSVFAAFLFVPYIGAAFFAQPTVAQNEVDSA
jgi:hypothetical protein